MSRRLLASILCLAAVALGPPAVAGGQVLAGLNHETTPDIPRVANTAPANAPPSSQRRYVPLLDSAVSRSAADALFVHSDLERARVLAERALQHNRDDAEALFVRMEVAAMQADDAAALDSAVRLCELGTNARTDPRVRLASVRVREAGSNTPDFRKAIPRIQALLANSQEPWPELHAALLNAAMDGALGLDAYAAARAAGILTDWRMVGPLGRNALLDFDQPLISTAEELSLPSYHNRQVENFQFPDGRLTLPDYLPHRGIFFAAAGFASLTPGSWTLHAESAGMLEIYVDGRRVLTKSMGSGPRASARFEISAGPHRVLAKFAASAAPLRIGVSASAAPEPEAPVRRKMSAPELTYELAGEHYADGEFGSAIDQINAVSFARDSAALQFLLAQSWQERNPTASDSATAWHNLKSLADGALVADVALAGIGLRNHDAARSALLAHQVLSKRATNAAALAILTESQTAGARDKLDTIGARDIWSRRLAAHPSCRALQEATDSYRAHADLAAAASVQHQLEGCAPESLAYAQSLSQQGSHAEAVQALQRLLAASPLDRAACLMLVRELQLSGDDVAAQHAAAEWLRVAPNAESYHRLAAGAETNAQENSPASTNFYLPYRRDALKVVRQARLDGSSSALSVLLLDDHVAISRPDGSVSLYVHTVKRVVNPDGGEWFKTDVPQDAQVLQLRIVHADGTASPLLRDARTQAASPASLLPGDAIEEEYVVNYTGDGGIAEHSEAFQFVFGKFNEQVISARFVALTPAEHADRGVVIATGEAPEMTANVRGAMLARVWRKDTETANAQSSTGMAIVRVVEQENGWTVPSNAEHQRRIETIHPGPRLEDSAQKVGGRKKATSATRL